MKLNLKFKHLFIAYLAPIKINHQSLLKNEVLNTALFINDELIGEIDFTALPFFHQYHIHQWQYLLELFFAKAEIDLTHIKFECPFFNTIKLPTFLPIEGELLFIIESLIFLVILKTNPHKILLKDYQYIKINTLYSPDFPLENSNDLPACLKIKISPTADSLKETIEIINSLLSIKPDIKFRLDGNRKFELDSLIHYMNKCELSCGQFFEAAIEYLEEPLKNFNDHFIFNKFYSYPLALDESIISFQNHLSKIPRFKNKNFIILKPSLLGISKSYEIINFCEDNQIHPIISSSYETISALPPFYFLASKNLFDYHGIDTHKFLPSKF